MISSRQGQLVLIVSEGQPGASSRPFEIAAAAAQTATSPAPNRVPNAHAAAVTTAIASAHADPAGPGNTGSAASARHQPVNTTRTASTRPANRRNQPRTVSAGRSSSAAIRRYPTPVALAASAAPITTATSARRTSTNTGNNTCVTPQPVQRARRGTSRTEPPRSRTSRARACPHLASTPQHPGHARTPDPSRRSTHAESISTVSTPHLRVPHTRLSRTILARSTAGGPCLPTRRSSRWRRRPPKSNQAQRLKHRPHAQRRQPRATSARSTAGNMWVPNWSSTSGDLGVFVYRSTEPIAPSEAKLGWRCRRW